MGPLWMGSWKDVSDHIPQPCNVMCSTDTNALSHSPCCCGSYKQEMSHGGVIDLVLAITK